MNSFSPAAIRVPPRQSGAAFPARSSAKAGVEPASTPVSRVSLVAKVKTSARSPPAAQ